ncbi:MAG: PIN domain-containing protein [Candidatus Bathyarchaeia archaeon]
MKNKENILKILLDTSFILPTLGIDVGSDVEECLKKLDEIKAEIYYSRFSIMECLWISARLMKTQAFSLKRFNQGLKSVIESGRYMKVNENAQIFIDAFKLYNLGHKDMIDNILYANSINFDLKLLTLDEELKEFVQNKGLNNTIMLPNQIT